MYKQFTTLKYAMQACCENYRHSLFILQIYRVTLLVEFIVVCCSFYPFLPLSGE